MYTPNISHGTWINWGPENHVMLNWPLADVNLSWYGFVSPILYDFPSTSPWPMMIYPHMSYSHHYSSIHYPFWLAFWRVRLLVHIFVLCSSLPDLFWRKHPSVQGGYGRGRGLTFRGLRGGILAKHQSFHLHISWNFTLHILKNTAKIIN